VINICRKDRTRISRRALELELRDNPEEVRPGAGRDRKERKRGKTWR
jgi:hypothetical protein